jgi:hypothetical protein
VRKKQKKTSESHAQRITLNLIRSIQEVDELMMIMSRVFFLVNG